MVGEASRTSHNSGGINGAAWSRDEAWVRRMPSQTVMTRALSVGVGQIGRAVGELDRGQPAAHGADFGTVPGQLGQVAADARRGRGQRLQGLVGAPGGELAPVGLVAANRVRRARRLDVTDLVDTEVGVVTDDLDGI